MTRADIMINILAYFLLFRLAFCHIENCTEADQNAYYHLHIPKAGGTSTKRYLALWNKERRFGCFASIEGTYNDAKVFFPDRKANIFSLFRDPVDHVLSQYQHCTTSYSHKYGWHLMPSLTEWLEAHVAHNSGSPRNVSAYNCYNPYNLQWARMEEHTPKELWLVGVLDHYKEGHCLLYYKLYGEVMGGCDCKSIQNLYVRHDQHGVQKYDKSKLTDLDYQYLHNLTRIDQLLYEAALSEFYSRVRNFERKTGVQLMGCSSES